MNIKIIIALAVAVLVGCSSVFAAMPERTPHNVEKYKKICRVNIQKVKKGMYREPKGSLKHKFITPGCGGLEGYIPIIIAPASPSREEMISRMASFVNKYMTYHRDKATGLLYWNDDFMIGVDNDPSAFYRPSNSSASIYLNALYTLAPTEKMYNNKAHSEPIVAAWTGMDLCQLVCVAWFG